MMNQEERLALAVRAEIAKVRGEQAETRAALLERRVRPFLDALERFKRAFGRAPDMDNPSDVTSVVVWAEELGGAEVSWDDMHAAAQARGEAAAWSKEAVDAMGALTGAWRGNQGETVLAWLGCDAATFERAVAEARASDASGAAPC